MEFTTRTHKPKTQSNIIAYSTVAVGPVWIEVSVKKGKEGGLFVNPPSIFVESLKSDNNNGHIQKGGFEKDFWPKVREKVLSDVAVLESPEEG